MDKKKIIMVCAECGTASCWYGEFMCSENKNACCIEKTIGELEEEGKKENEYYWSDKKMNDVYGNPAPFGYAT